MIMRILMTSFAFLLYGSVFAELTGPHYFDDPSGNSREYYLYVPENLPENSPLVYSLHGWGAGGFSMSSYGSFNSLAETYHFLVCYPTAMIDGDGGTSGLTSWNTNGMSDVDFILELNEYLINEYQLDENKVFSTGFSYGAEMSHHLARCQGTHVFAAIAPVGGAIFDYMDVCSPSIRTSVFVLHGTTDSVVYYDGGDFEDYGPYMSAPDAVVNWVNFNSCVFSESYSIPNDDTWTAGPVNVEKYVNLIDNLSVWFYSIVNLGHTWPTTNNSNIHASEEIWSFFQYVMSQSLNSMEEHTKSKNLVNSMDLLGREVNHTTNQIRFHLYDDGSVEKKIVVE
jgi:polyhydroxybutyrate depolymerase